MTLSLRLSPWIRTSSRLSPVPLELDPALVVAPPTLGVVGPPLEVVGVGVTDEGDQVLRAGGTCAGTRTSGARRPRPPPRGRPTRGATRSRSPRSSADRGSGRAGCAPRGRRRAG